MPGKDWGHPARQKVLFLAVFELVDVEQEHDVGAVLVELVAFLGTDGFSPERGLTTRFVEGGQVASLMRDRAEETWLVVDSSKYGQAGFVSFLPLSGVTGVITDSGLPPEAAEAIQEHTQLRVV